MPIKQRDIFVGGIYEPNGMTVLRIVQSASFTCSTVYYTTEKYPNQVDTCILPVFSNICTSATYLPPHLVAARDEKDRLEHEKWMKEKEKNLRNSIAHRESAMKRGIYWMGPL